MEVAFVKHSGFIVTRRQIVNLGGPNSKANYRDYSYRILCNKPRTWQSIWEAEQNVSDYQSVLLSVEPLRVTPTG